MTLNTLKVGAFVLFVLSNSTLALDEIDSANAADYIGKTVRVCGDVVQVRSFSSGTYINVGARYPNQHITFTVWEDDEELKSIYAKLGVRSLPALAGKTICAEGEVSEYRSRPQLSVNVAAQMFLKDG